MDGKNVSVGGAAQLATMFDEEAANSPASLLLASGDNVGASPANSGLLEDMPAIDVENAWGLDATSYGNHEFDYGVERLLRHSRHAPTSPSWAPTSSTRPPAEPGLGPGHARLRANGVKVGVIGIELKETPELVSAGATAGLKFLDEAETIRTESEKLRQQGIKVQIVLIHQGTANGQNPIGNTPASLERPDRDIVNAIQDTTVDVVLAGHTHRVSNLQVGHIPVAEGINAGASYSVVAAGRQGRRRRMGGRGHARCQEHRRCAARRREGHRRRCQRPDRRPAQPGDRHAAVRHQA